MKSWIPLLLCVVVLACGINCQGNTGSKDLSDDEKPQKPQESQKPQKHLTADSPELAAINQVLETHAEKLMATPGVVGIAISVLDDAETPCLKIMVAKMTPELETGLPRMLDGHPVVVEESGVFRPLGDQ